MTIVNKLANGMVENPIEVEKSYKRMIRRQTRKNLSSLNVEDASSQQKV